MTDSGAQIKEFIVLKDTLHMPTQVWGGVFERTSCAAENADDEDEKRVSLQIRNEDRVHQRWANAGDHQHALGGVTNKEWQEGGRHPMDDEESLRHAIKEIAYKRASE